MTTISPNPPALLLGSEKTGVSAQAGGAGRRASGDSHARHGAVVQCFGRRRTAAERSPTPASAGGMFNQRRIADDDYQRPEVEWCQPQDCARLCQRLQLPYPPLREDGELADPQGGVFGAGQSKRAEIPAITNSDCSRMVAPVAYADNGNPAARTAGTKATKAGPHFSPPAAHSVTPPAAAAITPACGPPPSTSRPRRCAARPAAASPAVPAPDFPPISRCG